MKTMGVWKSIDVCTIVWVCIVLGIGSSYKLNQENSIFFIILSSRTLERVFRSEIKGIW